jgi:hypothetical protein
MDNSEVIAKNPGEIELEYKGKSYPVKSWNRNWKHESNPCLVDGTGRSRQRVRGKEVRKGYLTLDAKWLTEDQQKELSNMKDCTDEFNVVIKDNGEPILQYKCSFEERETINDEVVRLYYLELAGSGEVRNDLGRIGKPVPRRDLD